MCTGYAWQVYAIEHLAHAREMYTSHRIAALKKIFFRFSLAHGKCHCQHSFISVKCKRLTLILALFSLLSVLFATQMHAHCTLQIAHTVFMATVSLEN